MLSLTGLFSDGFILEIVFTIIGAVLIGVALGLLLTIGLDKN